MHLRGGFLVRSPLPCSLLCSAWASSSAPYARAPPPYPLLIFLAARGLSHASRARTPPPDRVGSRDARSLAPRGAPPSPRAARDNGDSLPHRLCHCFATGLGVHYDLAHKVSLEVWQITSVYYIYSTNCSQKTIYIYTDNAFILPPASFVPPLPSERESG